MYTYLYIADATLYLPHAHALDNAHCLLDHPNNVMPILHTFIINVFVLFFIKCYYNAWFAIHNQYYILYGMLIYDMRCIINVIILYGLLLYCILFYCTIIIYDKIYHNLMYSVNHICGSHAVDIIIKIIDWSS